MRYLGMQAEPSAPSLGAKDAQARSAAAEASMPPTQAGTAEPVETVRHQQRSDLAVGAAQPAIVPSASPAAPSLREPLATIPPQTSMLSVGHGP